MKYHDGFPRLDKSGNLVKYSIVGKTDMY